jgi:hypothetical protein
LKISSFIIGFLVIALFTVVISFYVISINETYTSDINESALSGYDKIEELEELSDDMNQSLTTIQQGSAVDIIGGLATSGFTVLKTTWASFALYTDVANDAVDNSNLGESTSTWKAVALMIGILLFIFAMVGILIGRDV